MPFLSIMDIKVHYDSSWGKVLGQNGINALKAHVMDISVAATHKPLKYLETYVRIITLVRVFSSIS